MPPIKSAMQSIGRFSWPVASPKPLREFLVLQERAKHVKWMFKSYMITPMKPGTHQLPIVMSPSVQPGISQVGQSTAINRSAHGGSTFRLWASSPTLLLGFTPPTPLLQPPSPTPSSYQPAARPRAPVDGLFVTPHTCTSTISNSTDQN